MQYMGGKARIAKKLTEVMLSMTTERTFYLEPFMGGAWVLAQMAPHFSAPAAGDAMTDVALMWQAVQRGWVPPTEVSREWYERLKDGLPSPERAFAGFGCSFGGKWFGGYAANKRIDGDKVIAGQSARNYDYAGAAGRSIERKREAVTRTFIDHTDYRNWIPGPASVVYCDPPYDGTTPYTGAPLWDSVTFWATMRQWSAYGATVFVSEYAAPDDWHCVWESETSACLTASGNRLRVTEKLFTL